jgi:hypothetical protein
MRNHVALRKLFLLLALLTAFVAFLNAPIAKPAHALICCSPAKSIRHLWLVGMAARLAARDWVPKLAPRLVGRLRRGATGRQLTSLAN